MGLDPLLGSGRELFLPVHAFDEAVHIEDGLEKLLLLIVPAVAALRNTSDQHGYFLALPLKTPRRESFLPSVIRTLPVNIFPEVAGVMGLQKKTCALSFNIFRTGG